MNLCRTEAEPVPVQRCSQSLVWQLGGDSFEQIPCSEKEGGLEL